MTGTQSTPHPPFSCSLAKTCLPSLPHPSYPPLSPSSPFIPSPSLLPHSPSSVVPMQECPKVRPRRAPTHPLTPYIAAYEEISLQSRKRKKGRGRSLLGPAPHSTPVVNKGSNKLRTPPHNPPPFSYSDYDSNNGHWRRHSLESSRLPQSKRQYTPQKTDRRESDSFVYKRQVTSFDGSGPSSGAPHPHSPHPPPPPHSHSFTAPHAGQDFPRTPFTPPQAPLLSRNPRNLNHHDDFMGPPPAKLARRQSEPFDPHQFRSNTYDPQFHEQLPDEGFYHERYARSERGFRGSERAVSLIDTHHRQNSYHGDRTSHYGHW